MIEPTIGRVVLYRPKHSIHEPELRHAAQIAFVHSDVMVNLGCIDENGVHYNEQFVRLVQDDEKCDVGCCEWMAYQKAQAQELIVEYVAPAELSDEALKDKIGAFRPGEIVWAPDNPLADTIEMETGVNKKVKFSNKSVGKTKAAAKG